MLSVLFNQIDQKKINMDKIKLIDLLKNNGIKVTPQRISILSAVHSIHNHPTAQEIMVFVHKTDPNISPGTVYKTLDTFVEKNVISTVRTSDDTVRYDWIVENHHHIYTEENKEIIDYENDELDNLLEDFFSRNKIPNYEIESIKVHINGKKLKNKQ